LPPACLAGFIATFPALSKNSIASSQLSKNQKSKLPGMLYFFIILLAKTLLFSISDAFEEAPKTVKPAALRASVTPLNCGSSGPITTSSALNFLATSSTS